MKKKTAFETIKNKKALLNYFILDSYTAGIVLKGNEVKSIRLKNCSLDESYVQIINNEAWIINMHIGKYSFSCPYNDIDTRRSRKLLLNKKEILKIYRKKIEKSLTIIPLKLYFKNNKVKLDIGLAQGKKLHDKRQALKEKTSQREIQRTYKNLSL